MLAVMMRNGGTAGGWTAIAAVLGVVAFVFFGCGRTAPTSANRFLALGDSYTIGESVEPADRWPVRLAGALREKGADVAEPEIIARTGWTTDELSTAIDAADPRGPYRIVTLLIGVNNQYRGRGVAEFRNEFRRLLDRAVGFAGGKPLRVVVVSIPDWGVTPFGKQQGDSAKIAGEIDAFNAVCRDEAGRAGCRFVDVTPCSRTAAGKATRVAPDGLHPSAEMYRQWVELILPEAHAAIAE
jgi:lysophospholipase L1-like esterase